MSVKLTNVHKGELLTDDNLQYQQLIDHYSHLRGIDWRFRLKGTTTGARGAGSGKHAQIKMETKLHIGRDGEPVAEKTKLGWFVMSSGQEFDHNHMMLTQTSRTD